MLRGEKLNILTHFENEEKIREYIEQCERGFRARIDDCVRSLISDSSLKFITLSGPTCSGKTTAASMIVQRLEAAGYKVGAVSIDDFFFDRAVLDRRGVLDYDSIDTIDLELLADVIVGIEQNEPVMIPMFDFQKGKRNGYRRYKTDAHSITIFEGIQAVYPEVVKLFDKNDTKSIYISVAQDVSFDGKCADARTVRLLRRLVRDHIRRSAAPEFTLTLWKSVCENEDRSILPYKDSCDLKIDSLLGYELSVLREPVTKLLSQIEEGDRNYKTACELIKLFESVTPIDASFVPQDSLFCEFI